MRAMLSAPTDVPYMAANSIVFWEFSQIALRAPTWKEEIEPPPDNTKAGLFYAIENRSYRN